MNRQAKIANLQVTKSSYHDYKQFSTEKQIDYKKGDRFYITPLIENFLSYKSRYFIKLSVKCTKNEDGVHVNESYSEIDTEKEYINGNSNHDKYKSSYCENIRLRWYPDGPGIYEVKIDLYDYEDDELGKHLDSLKTILEIGTPDMLGPHMYSFVDKYEVMTLELNEIKKLYDELKISSATRKISYGTLVGLCGGIFARGLTPIANLLMTSGGLSLTDKLRVALADIGSASIGSVLGEISNHIFSFKGSDELDELINGDTSANTATIVYKYSKRCNRDGSVVKNIHPDWAEVIRENQYADFYKLDVDHINKRHNYITADIFASRNSKMRYQNLVLNIYQDKTDEETFSNLIYSKTIDCGDDYNIKFKLKDDTRKLTFKLLSEDGIVFDSITKRI